MNIEVILKELKQERDKLNKAIKQPDVNKTLTETLGMDVLALSPLETQKWIEDAIASWGKVVRDNNVRIE